MVLRRARDRVWRWSGPNVIVLGPDRSLRQLSGAAVVVWVALATDGSAADLRSAAGPGVDGSLVDDAVSLLLAEGLIEAAVRR